jgi:TetR/AcrR family transcriptional regulator
MLEKPGNDRITTAALAASLQVSEAALYRHFASKAQMFEGLIDFVEQSVFTLANQIVEREPPVGEGGAGAATRQAAKIITMVIQFAEKNPGLARVMVGDALVLEHERLQQRINQLFERLESLLRQCFRMAAEGNGQDAPTAYAQLRASVLTAFLIGRLQRYVRSGFRRPASDNLDASLAMLLG